MRTCCVLQLLPADCCKCTNIVRLHDVIIGNCIEMLQLKKHKNYKSLLTVLVSYLQGILEFCVLASGKLLAKRNVTSFES